MFGWHLRINGHERKKVQSLSHVRLFAVPWTVACQAPPSMGFSRQEYQSGLLCPPPGDHLNPGIKLTSLMFPALAGGFFNYLSFLRLMSIESVMPSKHLILCHPLLLLPSIIPSIRVFSNESLLDIRWPKYWSFSFSISPSNECSGLISFGIDWFDLFAVQGSLKSLLQHTVPKHQFFSAQPSLWSNSHIYT